jgi:hypothetical protein
MQSSRYIAHFDHDGNYMGAVHLDLPFQPLHLGVFDDGDFLIAGMEPSTGEPRVAIVGSNGQFRRYIELKGDVHLQDESDAPNKRNDLTALPRYRPSQTHGESVFDVVSLSQIAKDGPNLLLFRPFNGPVFSISAAGQVEVHKLGAEGDYRLFTIKPTSSAWIVELIREIPSHGAAEEFMTLAFDPQTDSPLREYFFPADLGWGLACTDGNEFTFVMADTESRNLKLVTLAPGSGSN